MKTVILAGGRGTRISEETGVIPKPMVEIGGRPILWHIMRGFAAQGFDEFVLCLGYKSEVIKRYFFEYSTLQGSVSINLGDGAVWRQNKEDRDDWTLHLMETGLDTLTGGRLLRVRPLMNGSPFMLTYGDGVSNVDVKALTEFHKSHGKLATVTAVRPPSRFGGLDFDESGQVREFIEKPQIGEGWINGGFMVLEPGVFDYLMDDQTILEAQALEQIAADGQLMAYRHEGYWACMDTLRDKMILNGLWDRGEAPWKVW